ncbi:MAG: glycosyltransferase family 2 protein [Flavobacteriales bacterium]
MKVATVILNWNGQHLLEQFLPKILANSADYAETWLADNNSTDDSVNFVKAHFPEVKIIQLERNMGYAGGYNTALQQIDADYFILLNSDIEVTPNWIEPIIDLFEKDPEIAAAQPKIKDFKHRLRFEYAGAAGGFIDKLGYPFCRGRIFEKLEIDKGQFDNTCEVFWASGACMFVRAQLFKEYGGFDESFFAHMEEIDLCWRFKNLGYKILACGSSTVYHIGGGTLSKSNWRKTYLNFRNNLELIYKNIETKYLFRTIFIRMVLDGLAAVKFLITNGFSHFWAIIRAHLHFYRLLPSIRQKRKTLQKQVKKRNVAGVYKGYIVVDYFIKKKQKFSQLGI